MKRFQSILCASLLTLAIGSTAFATTGTISATRNGTISATQNGTISATQNGTISATRNGTISATQASPGDISGGSSDFLGYVFSLFGGVL